MHETSDWLPDVLDRRGDFSGNTDPQRILCGCRGGTSDAGRIQSILLIEQKKAA